MANRQVRRKRKEKEKLIETNSFDLDSVNKLNVIAVVLLFLLGFYLLTLLITDKGDDKEEEQSKVTTISSEEIVLGRSLSMKDKEYLVIYYESSLEDTFKDSITNYRNKKESKIYIVDMSDGLNKKYAKETSNPYPKSIKEFSINGPTLIKVSDKNVVEYIEGEDNIKNYLN